MTEVKTVMSELRTISTMISRVGRLTGYSEFGDMSDLNVNRTLAEDIFMSRELSSIVESLAEIQCSIDYLTRPIKYESTLTKNEYGKYETEQGYEFSCGSSIEYLSTDEDYYDHPFWRKSWVEHQNGDYYIIAEPNMSLDSIKVRVREHE